MTISAHPPKTPPAVPRQPVSPRNEAKARTLGLTSATGLVIGSMVRIGIYGPGRAYWLARRRDRRGGCHPRRGDAARGFVRSAHQAGTGERRRPVRLFPPRVRRLGRLPRRLVLGPASAGNAAIVASWVTSTLSWPQTRQHGELGDRPARAVGTRDREPGWRPPDGLVPERHRRPQVPPSSSSVSSAGSSSTRPTSGRSTPRAAASTAVSASRRGWRCSPSSALRPPRSRRNE